MQKQRSPICESSSPLDSVLDITNERIAAYIKHDPKEKAAPATIRYELACLRRAVYRRRYAIKSAAEISEGVAKLATLHGAPTGSRMVHSLRDEHS